MHTTHNMATQTKDTRKQDLAKIHIAKKELALPDDRYRYIIQSVMDKHGLDGRVSSANLNEAARADLLGTFRDMGWSPLQSAAEPVSPPKHERGPYKGRYDSIDVQGYVTQDQLNYIAMMEDELGWTGEENRLMGMIERVLGKPIKPRWLRNRQASDIISALAAMTDRR